MAFTRKEKRQHYTAVAKGEKPVKEKSKFSKKEQQAYARGQRDALNENARITAWHKSTPVEREEYKAKQKAKTDAWKKTPEGKAWQTKKDKRGN